MTEQNKQIWYNLAAFILLFLVSLYRQLSLRYLPGDSCRSWILYACYVFLISAWCISVYMRVIQRSMRRFLIAEGMMMLTGLTIRFLQDTFWYQNVLLLRVSGLYIAATLLPMLLVGMYATLGIGQPDDFKVDRKWYLLLIPVFFLVYLTVTDERHHYVFFLDLQETQPNLNFHPGPAAFLMVACGFLIMIIRTFLIYWRNDLRNQKKTQSRLIPFIEPILMALFSMDYFLVSLQLFPALAGKEVIELYARVYYVEILTWEMYIFLGLVPINMEYQEIFKHATVGMQIISNNGRKIISEYAVPVTPEMFEVLEENDAVEVKPGKNLHIHHMKDGVFLWNQDVAELHTAIDGLNRSAETLAQEGILLSEELRTQNEEARLLAKNRIYDELTREITQQLRLMKEILKKKDASVDKNVLFRQLFLLGTYIKRRCNLSLIQKETGEITAEDMKLSLKDMASAIAMTGTQVSFQWEGNKNFTPDYAIWLFDLLEYILEYERFSLKEITILIDWGKVVYTVTGIEKAAPEEFSYPAGNAGYLIDCKRMPDGFQMILMENGDENVS